MLAGNVRMRRRDVIARVNIHPATFQDDLWQLSKRGVLVYERYGEVGLLNAMTTTADYLVAGMQLPALDEAPQGAPTGARCALTGVAIERGYPVADIVPDSAGEFLDMLAGGVDGAGWFAPNVARAFKGTWNMGAWMIFEDGTGYHPLINRAAALEQGRPCWSQLVRDVWRDRRGMKCVCILTTDFKKRLWPRARVGVLGEATPVLLHDPDQHVSGPVTINWQVMLEALDLVERAHTAGFSKPGIAQSLLREWTTAQATPGGLRETMAWETQLQQRRGTHEFAMAVVIAQRAGHAGDAPVKSNRARAKKETIK
jgi:hypothetical protein